MSKTEYFKAYRAAHREEINAKNKEYNAAHKEQISIRMKARYQSNKEQISARNKACRITQYAILKRSAFERYGNRCACCGETESAFLTIDHVNNDGAKHRKEIGTTSLDLYRWLRNNNYPDGFQLLCANCHLAKTYLGICPHKRRIV